MTKCPSCGSTAQVKVVSEEVLCDIKREFIQVRRHYTCGCSACFYGTVTYQVCDNGYEEIKGYDTNENI